MLLQQARDAGRPCEGSQGRPPGGSSVVTAGGGLQPMRACVQRLTLNLVMVQLHVGHTPSQGRPAGIYGPIEPLRRHCMNRYSNTFASSSARPQALGNGH